ncbi:DUF4232 domain-containing protein [Saccharothrix xinjiangensis]|uniref:DUF4232 domain-containing protein n=1 Tax=Saccharothrix xinjiangensis TaxID=204798 RepID=UPI0031D4C030
MIANALKSDPLRSTGGVEQCLTAGVGISLGSGHNDMQGFHVPLRFTNTGSRPCTLQGAPGVSYVTGEGEEQIGLPAERGTGGPVVTLAPGETASAALFLSSAPRKTPACEQVRAGGLRVYPPDNTEPVFVEHGATTCAPPLDGPFLEVGPVRPGAGNTRT